MSSVTTSATRVAVSVQNSTNRLAGSARKRVLMRRSEIGSAAADYLATALVAVALVMAIFGLVTTHSIDGVLADLIKKALTTATNLIKPQ
jgi:hypothetical protein